MDIVQSTKIYVLSVFITYIYINARSLYVCKHYATCGNSFHIKHGMTKGFNMTISFKQMKS